MPEKPKIHYIQSYFQSVFHNFPFADIKITQVANGWIAVLICKKTGNVYRLSIEEMKSQTKVGNEVTVDQLIAQGGFYE